MVRNIILASTILVLIAILVAVSCSGGDAGSADSGSDDLQAKVTTHDNGQVETTGQVDAAGRRQGYWEWFAPGGEKLFQGHFVDDHLDETRPWTEWNADGSTRFDHTDGAHPQGDPF